MRPWFIAGALLFAAAGLSDYARAADTVEYRTVTLTDGSIHLGVVVGSDADSLRLRTLKGEEILPIETVVKIETISRETYLTREGRRLVYLGVAADPSLQPKAAQIDAIMIDALKRDDLLVLSPDALPGARHEQLDACGDLACKLKSLLAEEVFVVYGELERKEGHDRVTFRRFDRTSNQLDEVSLAVDTPEHERSRLVRTAALVLGEKPAPEPEAVAATPTTRTLPAPTGSEPASSSSSTPPAPTGSTASAAREKDPAAPDVPSSSTTAATAHTPPSAGVDLARARRLDLVPLPGASSLIYYDKVPQAVVAAGVVAAVSGAAVYVAGDLRVLGAQDGLPVPWTHEERGFRDAALLTGVGAVSYLASTWIVNQVLGRMNRHARGAVTPSR